MPKDNKDRVEELLRWLRQHDIICNAAKLHRMFSDGVVLANLLKKTYPKLVELHNYPPQSSMRLKFANWETLNAKVLSKLGMPQTKTSLESLAKGEKHAIEILLLRIMKAERDRNRKSEGVSGPGSMDHLLITDNQKLTVTINKKIGDALVKVPQEMVLYSVYENVMHDIEKKNTIVGEMKERIDYLEADIEKLKCRIKNLMDQEEKVVATRMASFKIGNIMGLLESRRLKPNQLTKYTNIQSYSSFKELTPSICSDTPSLPLSIDVPNTLAGQNSMPLDLPKTACSKNSKVTKIPTLNGQALKSIREKCKNPELKSHGDTHSLKVKSTGQYDFLLPTTPTSTGKNSKWNTTNNSQNMHAQHLNLSERDFITSSTENLNRFIANIKSSGSIVNKATAHHHPDLDNKNKFKSHEKYDITNFIMGSLNSFGQTEAECNDLLPFNHLKSSISKSETKSNFNAKKDSNSKNILDLNAKNFAKTTTTTTTDKALNDKMRLMTTSQINDKHLYSPNYDDNPYLPTRSLVEEEMNEVSV